MAEEISSPLLSLVKELGLIDDLQYEEVAAEFKRSGTLHVAQMIVHANFQSRVVSPVVGVADLVNLGG